MQLRTLTPGLGFAMTIAAAGASFTTLPAAAADGFTLKDKPKIAMLYFGPKNDGGWTQAFDEARVKIEKEIGQKIQFVENVPEDASAIKPAAEKFIQRGANIVIGTAFGYSDSFKDLAAKYPVAFVPFLLDQVALNPALMQADGIHANARGQPQMLENVWPKLKPLLVAPRKPAS